MNHSLKIFVTGIGGQVGHSLTQTLKPFGKLIVSDLQDNETKLDQFVKLDLSNTQNIRDALERIRPSLIVNPAAYTAVDKAESQQEVARAINRDAPKAMAEYCEQNKIPLIHYSTDYVFPGDGVTPWKESDQPQPTNYYGLSKWEGEQEIIRSGCTYIILRTSWVFSDFGNNFVKTMLKLGSDRTELKVVEDQIGAPTSADFLARNTAHVIQLGLTHGFDSLKGIYHLCNSGETNWYLFAKEIFNISQSLGKKLSIKNVYPISTDQYPTPAKRPKNSRLNCDKFKETFKTGELQCWTDALAEVLGKMSSKNFVL